ncbi:hypothetical protein JS85_25405 [Vibrio vulnificus]|nr:hypothetical protein JS85_25405 [Vibrio vulnificus]
MYTLIAIRHFSNLHLGTYLQRCNWRMILAAWMPVPSFPMAQVKPVLANIQYIMNKKEWCNGKRVRGYLFLVT